MKKFAIYVDSGANIPNDIRIARDIRVIPFHYMIDGEEHPCFTEDMPFEETAKKFYDAMRAGAEAKTSLRKRKRHLPKDRRTHGEDIP